MANRSKDPLDSLTWDLKPATAKIPRAPRVPTDRPLRVRAIGQTDWSQGFTFNVSPTGVLFRANHIITVDTIVHMSFTLPDEIAGSEGAEVFCRGQIVRTLMPATSDGQPHMAAKIMDYLPRNEAEDSLRQAADDGQETKAED